MARKKKAISQPVESPKKEDKQPEKELSLYRHKN